MRTLDVQTEVYGLTKTKAMNVAAFLEENEQHRGECPLISQGIGQFEATVGERGGNKFEC
jgi:hypothetical protein